MANSSNSIELTKSCPKESKFVELSKIEFTEAEKLSQKDTSSISATSFESLGISNDSYSIRTKPYRMKKKSFSQPFISQEKKEKKAEINSFQRGGR